MTLQIPGYTELAQLGEGPTGSVVLARYQATGAVAAIKRFSLQLTRDQTFLERFRADARVLEQLRHPNLVSLYDYVEQGAEAAVVSELADGVSLRTVLETYGRVEAEASLVVLKDVLSGLRAAHDAGLVHRALKPENVMLTGEGVARLLDTGVAVQSGVAQWRSGMQKYMAPEQWGGSALSARTDVYAAAAVFFECLAGHVPFLADELTELRLQHEVTPVPMESVPVALRELVQRGLEKDALRRFATAGLFLAELETVAVAAYGADWEERGRRRLASMALGLDALFPLTMFAGRLAGIDGAAAAGGGRAAAPLAIADGDEGGGRRRWGTIALAGLAAVAVIGVGSLGGMALARVGPFAAGKHAPITGLAGASPTPSDTPSDAPFTSATPYPTDTPLPTPSDTPTPSPTPAPTPTPTPRPTATPSPAPKPLAVTGVSLPGGNNPSTSQQQGQCTANALADITTNGSAGTVTVYFDWSYVSSGQTVHDTKSATFTAASGTTSYPPVSSSIDIPSGATSIHVHVYTTPSGPTADGTATPHGSC